MKFIYFSTAFALFLLSLFGTSYFNNGTGTLASVLYVIFIVFSVIFGIFSFVFGIIVFIQDSTQIKINKSGELVKATVVSVNPTGSWKDDKSPVVVMELEVQEENGASYRANIRADVDLAELALTYQPGRQIEVVRDRENREQVVLKHRFFKELQEKYQKDMAKKRVKMASQV